MHAATLAERAPSRQPRRFRFSIAKARAKLDASIVEALMRRWLTGMSLLAIPVLALAAGRPRPVDLTMSWILTLDKTGAIKSMQATETKNAGLYQRLETGIRKYWKFVPNKIKGNAGDIQTTLTVHSTLEPVDGFYAVRVHDASTGARYASMIPAPQPVKAQGAAGVLLDVSYDASGRVTTAKAVAGGSPKAGGDAERAAIAAVKQWTFKPETVGGKAVAGKVRVPVCLAAPAMQKACGFVSPETKKAIDAERPQGLRSVVRIETDVTTRDL
jgi:TonB family protein